MSALEQPEVVAIAAVASNGVIGNGVDIPWRIPEDWRRFRSLTLGHVLVMGRRTYDSIGRPLPGRDTIVVTRHPDWRMEGVRVAHSIEDAFELGYSLRPTFIFVAGGGDVYRACWPRLHRLEITEVHQEPAGDVTFPAVQPEEWRETLREDHEGFSWVSHERRAQPR